MKKTLSLAVLFGALTMASAQVNQVSPTNQILYQQDWGAVYGAVQGNTAATTLAAIGWNAIYGSATAYTGMYGAAGAFDVGTRLLLPNRPCYFSSDTAGAVGIIYTTDASGSGTSGDSSFADIDPTLYSNLTISVESQVSAFPGYISNYFAVQVGGAWYVSTNNLTNNNPASGLTFRLNSLLYTNLASSWNTLTLDTVDTPNTATIGPVAPANLTGPITGIGLVQVWTNTMPTSDYPGINYLNLSVTAPINNPAGTAPVINGPGYSQTTYAGGGASFAVSTGAGSPALTYSWQLNGGLNLTDGPTGTGSTIFGSATSQITISNVSASDGGTYTAVVANSVNSDTTANYVTTTLTVNPVPADVLYAETFPFVGPYGTAENLSSVGWSNTLSVNNVSNRLEVLGGRGIVDAYEPAALTVAYYTTTNLETGTSGMPFAAINPSGSPYVSFRASLPVIGGGAYFAVRMGSGQWYVSSSAIQTTTPVTPPNTFGLQFSTAVSGWNLLTVNRTSASVGGPATTPLSGNITGVGMVFVQTAGSQYTLTNFSVVTDSTPPVPASFPSEPNVPYPQTVYAGGGASFSFTEAGTSPLTNNWELNDSGTYLTDGTNPDGSSITGSSTTNITLQNVGSAEAGIYSAFVSNPANSPPFSSPISTTDTSTYGSPVLTVTPPPLGLIYNESFPLYYAFTSGVNQPLRIIGWTNQSDTPARIFKIGAAAVGTGAAYAYEGNTTNSLFYASTTSDTGFSGLPFIAFDPANYPPNSIQFTTALANGNAAYTNISVSFAVQQGGQWYAMATAVWQRYNVTPPTTPLTATYVTQPAQTYSPTASLWNTLTFVSNGVVGANGPGLLVGGAPAKNLSGSITAAGLLFQHFTTAGGSINFNLLNIQATGAGNLIGGVNIGPVVNGNGTVTLTWIGNAAVNLQTAGSATSTFTDVPNTLGQHSFTVTPAGLQQYYRLVMH